MRNFMKCTLPFLFLFFILFADRSLITIASSVSPTPTTLVPEKTEALVNFNLNYKTSKSYDAKLIAIGKKYGKLPTPQRKGYTFKGWYTDATSGKRVKSSTRMTTTQDHVLYARWKINTYKVKFNARGGKVSKSSCKVTYNSKYGKLPTPTKKGYTFNGWFTKKTGGTEITSKSKVKITKNTTLYAHWDYQYPEIILQDYNMSQSKYSKFPYVQTQTAYKNIMLGNSSYSLARSGCLTCNIALIMTYHGEKTLPTKLADNSHLYTSGGLLIWGSLPDKWSQEYCTKDVALKRLYELLSEGKMPSVCLRNSYGGMHWVTVYGYSGSKKLSADNFLIFDPGKYANKTLQDVTSQRGDVSRIIYIDN